MMIREANVSPKIILDECRELIIAVEQSQTLNERREYLSFSPAFGFLISRKLRREKGKDTP